MVIIDVWQVKAHAPEPVDDAMSSAIRHAVARALEEAAQKATEDLARAGLRAEIVVSQ